jgi:hypothetical protein
MRVAREERRREVWRSETRGDARHRLSMGVSSSIVVVVVVVRSCRLSGRVLDCRNHGAVYTGMGRVEDVIVVLGDRRVRSAQVGWVEGRWQLLAMHPVGEGLAVRVGSQRHMLDVVRFVVGRRDYHVTSQLMLKRRSCDLDLKTHHGLGLAAPLVDCARRVRRAPWPASLPVLELRPAPRFQSFRQQKSWNRASEESALAAEALEAAVAAVALALALARALPFSASLRPCASAQASWALQQARDATDGVEWQAQCATEGDAPAASAQAWRHRQRLGPWRWVGL